MTAFSWVVLAAAVALLPLPSATGQRTTGLARRGRLAPVPVLRPRLPWARAPALPCVLLGCVALAAAAGVFGGMALGVAAAGGAATLARLGSGALSRRRAVRCRRSLLSAIRLLVAELEAGSRPGCALAAAAAVAPHHLAALSAAASTAEEGGDVAEALLNSGAADLGPLAHAWRVGTLSGAPIADVLARVADGLVDHEHQHRAVAVALAGPRSSGALLAVLPVVGIGLGAAMGAHPLAVLLGTPGGRLLCCAGVLLDAAGLLWTQLLIHAAQRG